MSEILLEIDGKEVKATAGMTILEAARSVGISIPTPMEILTGKVIRANGLMSGVRFLRFPLNVNCATWLRTKRARSGWKWQKHLNWKKRHLTFW